MDTDQLLNRVAQGEESAATELLARHKDRLRRMIQLRMDSRLSPRLDPSDVVQDVLIEAHKKLRAYADDRCIAFYPWLREIAWETLIDLNRRHIYAQRRSIRRETNNLDLSNESHALLVDRLEASAASPSEHLIQAEVRSRLQSAISQLRAIDREVIVLRHLEELSFSETAAVLGLSENAVYSRYRRAIERLHSMLHQG